MPTAIISGYHGFIGSHLKKRLESLDYKVIGLERGEISTEDFDYFFHLSAYGNHYHQKDEKIAIDVNCMYLFDILNSIKVHDKKFRAFVYFSTSSVTLPIQTVYSVTKKIGEELCQYYAKSLPIAIVRPYSVFGEGEADFRFIPTIINNGLKGDKSKIIPDPRHDWIYVKDLIEAILLVAQNIDNLKGQTISIGTGISWSNQEVIEIIDDIFKQYDDNYKEIFYDILSHNIRSYDTEDWKADVSILKGLGWQQKYSLREGLIECYKYYKKRYDQFRKTDIRNKL